MEGDHKVESPEDSMKRASIRRASLTTLNKKRLSKEAEDWAVANAVASVVDNVRGTNDRKKRLSFAA